MKITLQRWGMLGFGVSPQRELPLSVWKNNYPSCTSHDLFPAKEVSFFAASLNLSWLPVLQQFLQILIPKYLEPAPWSCENGSPKPQWIHWKLWSAMQSFQLNITGFWPWKGKSQSSFGNDTLWPAVCCSTLSLINDQKWWLKQASKREHFA